jgi:hypothetical protein
MKPVTIKIWLSLLLWFLHIILFVGLLFTPGLFGSWDLGSLLYLALALSLILIVAVVGWFGATLTFPVE